MKRILLSISILIGMVVVSCVAFDPEVSTNIIDDNTYELADTVGFNEDNMNKI